MKRQLFKYKRRAGKIRAEVKRIKLLASSTTRGENEKP